VAVEKTELSWVASLISKVLNSGTWHLFVVGSPNLSEMWSERKIVTWFAEQVASSV